MASHFTCIGLTAADQAAFFALLDSLIERAEEVGGPGHLYWRDPSGAALAFHVDGNAIECVTPFFDADDGSTWLVETSAPADDPGCEHCGGADCDLLDASGEMVTRSAVQWLQFQAERDRLAAPA